MTGSLRCSRAADPSRERSAEGWTEMPYSFETFLLAVSKRLSALEGDHEHRTGLGLARADPAALTAFMSRAADVTSPIGAAGKWADRLAAQIVAGIEMLLLGLPGRLRPGAKAERHGNRRAGSSDA